MKKNSKQEMILEAIIKAYLEESLPVGSNELQAKMAIEISASTIRSYFQKLSGEGILMQLHISGGRIPTVKALRDYWLTKLEVNNPIVLKTLPQVRNTVKEFGLYCVLEFNENEVLKEVLAVSDRYILLVFSSEEVTISYSSEAFGFLNSLIGIGIYDLRALANRVGFSELCLKLDKMMVGKVLFQEGEEVLYEMAKENENRFLYNFFKDLRSILELDEGIYFERIVPDGYMAVKQRAKVGGADAKMLCLGRLNTDFESFFNKAKE
ncbi:MAG: HrcA family transcriptional regulator [Campylobacteraceae bacterium]